MSKTRIKIRDKGADKMMRKLKRHVGVRVGIFGEEMATIGAIHEFGTSRIPERSWLRGYIDENATLIRRRVKKYAVAGMKPNGNLENVFEIFGALTVGEIQERISDGIDPPNAPSTIAKKGSAKPLIDRGILRATITHIVEVSK